MFWLRLWEYYVGSYKIKKVKPESEYAKKCLKTYSSSNAFLARKVLEKYKYVLE